MQCVKQSKKGCAELANRVAELARDVSQEIRGREELVHGPLEKALEQLHRYIYVPFALYSRR